MRKLQTIIATSLLVILLLPVSMVFAQTTEPEALFLAAAEAYSKRDLDTLMNYFNDDAVLKEVPATVIRNTTTFTGKQQVRQWFQRALEINVSGKWMPSPTSKGDTFTLLQEFRSDELTKAGVEGVLNYVEVVSSGGKIKSFSLTYVPLSVEKLKNAGFIIDSAALVTALPATGTGRALTDNSLPAWGLALLGEVALAGFLGLKFFTKRKVR